MARVPFPSDSAASSSSRPFSLKGERDDGDRSSSLLVVGTDEWSFRGIHSVLVDRAVVVSRATTIAETLHFVRSTPLDVVVVDHRPPLLDAIGVCRAIRDAEPPGFSLPVVVMAEAPERVFRAAAFASGAWQVLASPLDGEIFVTQIETFCRAKREIDWARADALVDKDTGLYTARGLMLRANELAATALRRREPLACVVVALEDGTPGDDTELEVARLARLCGSIGRISDAIGRAGEREVGIFACGIDRVGAKRLADRVCSGVDSPPVGAALSVRVGYSAANAEIPLDPTTLLARAKAAGRRGGPRTSGTVTTAFGDLPTEHRA